MSSKVVCISRMLAAGGEEVGRLAAEELGFRYADNEIIVRAAEQVGVAPDAVQQAEYSHGLIGRILEAMGKAPVMQDGYLPLPPDTPPSYERLIEHVIRETANEGDVVLVAHGASHALAGTDGLLRVLVTASPAVRIERLVQDAKLSEKDAKKAVEDSDHQRRDYLRRFYQVQEELPTHYDLVVNTDSLTPAQAAHLVTAAAKG